MVQQVAERETTEITTPAGHKVVLRTYLTGKESNALKTVMYSALKINASEAGSGKVALSDIPAAFMIEQERKAIEFLLVSIDGETVDAFNKLENMPESEYAAVAAEVQRIRVPLVPAK